MPYSGTQVKNKNVPFCPRYQEGQYAHYDYTGEPYPYQGAGADFLTGGTNALIADATYSMASDLTLLPTTRTPLGLRLAVVGLKLAVHGNVGWAGGTALTVKDTDNGLIGYYPLISLTALSRYTFPINGTNAPLLATVTAYDSTTGVMTFAASTLITTVLALTPFTVVAGTGRGQSGVITSNTATTITPDHVLPTALDTTSVVAVYYYAATAATGITISASNAVGWTTNSLSKTAMWVLIISGTGAGQYKQIVSNTTTQLTVSTWDTTPDTTSIFQVTNTPQLQGAVDCAVSQSWRATSANAGLKASLIGTFTGTTSSPIRLEGHVNYIQ